MKKTTCLLLTLLLIYLVSCKEDSTSVSNITNPPAPDTGWVLGYHDYNIGTLSCTFSNPCLIDIVTDTIDITSYDSMRIYLSYHSIRNNSLSIFKIPYPVQLCNCVFQDSTYGKLDKTFGSFNSKILLDFGFAVGSRFTIDTLQIYKK
jgi:hypothetical protein